MRMDFEKESNESKASPRAKVAKEKKCTFEKAMRMDLKKKHTKRLNWLLTNGVE